MNNNIHLDIITTGFKQLDEFICGKVLLSQLIIIGGRPIMRKTTFVLNRAVKKEIDGRPVVYVSICMDERQLLSRILSFVSRN